MKPLDELRESTKREARWAIMNADAAIDAAFDAFEALHPGLVDYTRVCATCGERCIGGTVTVSDAACTATRLGLRR